MVFRNENACRRRIRKKFAYEADDESANLNATETFRTTFFLVVMDKAIASFNQRFQQMNDFHEKFGFLFEIVKHRVTDAETNDSALRTQCLNLQTLLSSQTECETASSDIDGLALFDELKTLHNISIIPEDIDSLLELLRFLHVNCLHEVFPNVSVALRVVLTIPVTVASGERSFSKLKLIKTFLRSSMKEDRMNSLALLSIENALASELDYSSLITKFAAMKARRVSF